MRTHNRLRVISTLEYDRGYRAACVTCLRLDVGPQHVTAREMLESETLRYPTRHGPFPRARSSHYHRPKDTLQTHGSNFSENDATFNKLLMKKPQRNML